MARGDTGTVGTTARRVRTLAVAAILMLALAAPAAARADTEDFESPALTDGTKVGTQFQSTSGVYFTESPGGGIYLPEIDDDAPARSGTRTVDITTGPSGEEFPHPGLEGRFDTVVEDLTLYVRNMYAPSSANITLTAFREGGGTVTDADSSVTSAEGWVKLEVDAGAGNSFFRFQVNAATADAAKEIRVDDLEFTVDAAAAPSYTLSTEEVGGVALPGQPKQYKIQIQRLNGYSEQISFSGFVFGVLGETVGFSPNPTSGALTTVTMTLPGDASEAKRTLVITSTSASLPNQTLEIEFLVESPFSIRAVGALPVRADRCTTTPAAFQVIRNRFFSDPINVSVAAQSGSIPADLGASVAPATILSLETANTVTLRVTRGDDPDSTPAVPLKIVASSGGVERALPLEVVRAPPRLTSVAPTTLFAPQALVGGSGVTIRGHGLCPGARVQFGNELATAPATLTPSPTAGDPTRMQVTASTPRLATRGPVSVVNPSGAVASGAGLVPNATVNSYRNRFGFSFPNEDGKRDKNEAGEFVEPPPVGAGSLRDWQELLGPRQTNLNACDVGLWFPGCWEVITPIPTPQHGIMQTILGEASYYNRGGTCVGLSIASRRIAARQATVRGTTPAFSTAPVWSLQRTDRETIPGRRDIPLEGQAQYSPIKYGAILHPAQSTAEYIEMWVARRSLNAISGPDAMRRAIEGHLRAGRRPLLNINWDGGGHAVNVYDVEDRAGGGYFLRVYDNNYPYVTGEEASDGAGHRNLDETLSRFEVTPGGSWIAPGLPVTVGKDDAGNPIREPREGPTGDLSWIAVENELPVVPSSLASLDGLRALATPGLSASIAAPADPTDAAKTGVFELGYLDGEGGIVTADSDSAHALALEPGKGGKARIGVFGEGATAEVRMSGGSASASAKGRRNLVLLPKGSTDGIGLRAASSATGVDLTLVSDQAGRLVKISGARGGTTRVKLVGKRGKIRLDHKGRPSRVKVEIASFGRRGSAAAKFVTAMRIGRTAKLVLAPNWNRLGRRVTARLNGKRVLLRNRARPPVRVRKLRVGAKRRGRRALTKVRARLVGKLGKLDALVLGVEILKGKKVVSRSAKQLRPGRRSAKRLAKGITVRSKLKSKGRLRARAIVTAVVADPLPSGGSSSASAPVR